MGKANQQQEQLVGPLVSWPSRDTLRVLQPHDECPLAHPTLARIWYHQLLQTVPIREPYRLIVQFSTASTLIFSIKDPQASRRRTQDCWCEVFHSEMQKWTETLLFFFFLVCLFVGLAAQSIKRVDLLTGNPQTPIDVMMKCWVIEQTCSVCFDRSSSSWKKARIVMKRTQRGEVCCSSSCL